MAWTHSDWNQQSGAAAKLAKLRLFHEEVTDKLGPEIAADGSSRSTNTLMRLLETIEGNIERLERITGEDRPEIGVIRADFGGGGT